MPADADKIVPFIHEQEQAYHHRLTMQDLTDTKAATWEQIPTWDHFNVDAT